MSARALCIRSRLLTQQTRTTTSSTDMSSCQNKCSSSSLKGERSRRIVSGRHGPLIHVRLIQGEHADQMDLCMESLANCSSYFADDDSGLLRILDENEWRGIGITQSLGWEHFEVHGQPSQTRLTTQTDCVQHLSHIFVSLIPRIQSLRICQNTADLATVLFRRPLVSAHSLLDVRYRSAVLSDCSIQTG